jgi:hypothetical protein
LAAAESAAQWEHFLGDLVRRGLVGERLEMLCVDGGTGLLAALPTAFPDIPVQRCWAPKIRNVLNKVRRADQPAIKADLHRMMNARTLPVAWSAARRFADRWEDRYAKAVACLRTDLADLLTCFRYPTLEARNAVRTTNAIERRFREVRRRTRPMGTFQDNTSMDRILFAVFLNENRNQGLATPLRPDTNLLTLPPVGAAAGRGENGWRSLQVAERVVLTAFGELRPIPFPSAAALTSSLTVMSPAWAIPAAGRCSAGSPIILWYRAIL